MAEPSSIAKYTALFGDDFAPIINALNNTLTPAVESQVLNIMDDLALRAEIFGKEIQRTVTRMGRQGASMEAIKTSLKRDMQTGGRIFSSLRNDVKEGIVEQINQSGRLGQMTQYKDANIFTWITVQGHKVCVDCSQRSGQTMSWDDWVAEGLPASGWSVCKGHCYCVLDPSGKIGSPVTAPTHVVEKGASIKTPPAWKPSMTTQEAAKWNKNSKFQGRFFHGTSSEGMNGIRKSGFDFNRVTSGKIYGNGAYGTRNAKEIARAFAGGAEGEVMEIAFNIQNPLVLNDDLMRAIISGQLPYKEGARSMLLQNGTRMKTFGEVAPEFYKYQGKAKKKFLKRVHKHRLKSPNANPIEDFEQFLRSEFDNKFNIDKIKVTKAHNKAFELGNKWYEHLDDLYIKGDKRVIRMMDESLDSSRHGWRHHEEFGDLFTEFLQKQGYDGLVVEDVGHIVKMNLFDDYFVAFNKKSVTAIVN